MSAKEFDAIVFAGGRGSRLGGIDKATLILDDKRMVSRVIEAARNSKARKVIVVGPKHAGSLADFTTREEPPFAGPLSALAAGFEAAEAPWVMLLPCDLVHPEEVVKQLLLGLKTAVEKEYEGVVLLDDEDQIQWLTALVGADALHKELTNEALGSLENKPAKAVLSQMRLLRIPAATESTADIDTHEQLEKAKVNIRKGRTMTSSSNSHPAILDEWLAVVADNFGLEATEVSIPQILNVAADVAHSVARPAAPLSTFLLGLALGKSAGATSLDDLAKNLSALAKSWQPAEE